jgi:hypothetical protein
MISSRRAEALSEPWCPHPVLAAISDDDPALQKILRAITKPVLSMVEIVEDGPFRRTMTYAHANSYDNATATHESIPGGLLATWIAHGRRFAFALDYAKYLLALKRLGEQARGRDFGITRPTSSVDIPVAVTRTR